MIAANNKYDLSIIIVSYNTKSLIHNCIESIIKHLSNKINFEVIIVDNFSSDGSIAILKDYTLKHTNILVKYLQENTGFSRANNLGIEQSSAPFLLLLNSDTYFIDDSLKDAVSFMAGKPKLFGIGCQLLTDKLLPGVSYGTFPGLKTVTLEFIFNQYTKRRAIIPEKKEAIHSIDFPCGAFFLIRKADYYTIGGLDNNFFMYFEETDLSKRAWNMGYEIKYYPYTQLVHIGGGSGPFSINAKSYFYKSWNYYLKKHESAVNRFCIKCVLTAHFIIQIFKACIKLNKKYVLENWLDVKMLHLTWK